MKRTFFVCLLCASLAGAVYAQTADAHILRGIEYHNNGKYAEAVAEYTEALRINPNLPVQYQNRGKAYQMLKDYDRAAADFTEAIRLRPTAPDSRLNGIWINPVADDGVFTYIYTLGNGVYELTLFRKESGAAGSTEERIESSKGTYMANNNTILFTPTHIGVQDNSFFKGDWLEIPKGDFAFTFESTPDRADEVKELTKKLNSNLNAIKNSIIEYALENSGAYSFSDAGLRLGRWDGYTSR